MSKILLVEDDENIVKMLTEFLFREGFECASASGQKQALALFRQNEFDLALVDISLSDGSGFAVCTAIKQERDIPVVFLTASGDEYSVVTGLTLGADDYIAKPFRPRELILRIRGILRRTGKTGSLIGIGNLTVDTERGAAFKNGKDLCLSALEYRLLLVLLNNRGHIMTRTQLLESIWDAAGDFINDNTLTVYIKRLREKTEDDPQNPTVIKTVRGQGYIID